MEGDSGSHIGADRVGSFTYLHDGDQWEWSDEVAAMHGYTPGTVTPTTKLVLSHKHPDDRPDVAALIEQVQHRSAIFSSRHRIIDTHGDVHMVMVVGDAVTDGSGGVAGTRGFYVDITDSFEADLRKSVNERVATAEEHRAVINQAMGMLSMTYGLSAQQAFDLLIWQSQRTNAKLRLIAERLVSAIPTEPLPASSRTRVDHILLTAHERLDHAETRNGTGFG